MTLGKTVHAVDKIRFVDHVFKNEATWSEHEMVPFLTWPNGMPCNYANLYLLHLIKQKLSTTGRGGSVRQYAYTISRYIVFCHTNRVGLLEISNAQFSMFVGSLRIDIGSGKRNAENTVLTNGRVILAFLHHIETLQQLDVVKLRLGAERKVTAVRYNGKTLKVEAWAHPSFGAPSPKKRRSAIEAETIDRLRLAAEQSSDDNYVVSRRQILIKTLEITGARISECAAIQIENVVDARTSGMLEVITLKRGEPHTRMIPILSQDLTDLEDFLILRKVAIRAAKVKDDGYLFFSTKTGRRMTGVSLGNEIGMLRRLSGILKKASAHLFRHRFITKILIALIDAHEFENPQQMRRAFQEIESLKVILKEWTGHRSSSSLDAYIDTAFSEWENMAKTIDKAFAKRAFETFADRAFELVEKLGKSVSTDAFKQEFRKLHDNVQTDIVRKIKSKQEP